jgi:hypothetical protein
VRVRRIGASLAAATIVLALLTSCSVPAIAWFRVDNGSLTGFAVCNEFSRVDAIRVVVENSRGEEVSWQTFGGPAISVGVDTELDFTHLPPGWRSLEAAASRAVQGERYIYVEAFTNGDLTFTRYIRTSDDEDRQWISNGGWQRCPHERGTSAPESSPLVTGLTGPDAARASVGHEPMATQRFWRLLSPNDGDESATRIQVEARLAKLSLRELKEFHARLLLEIFDLDTFATWSAVQAQWGGYSAADPDDFLSARLELISAGESAIEDAKVGVIAEGVVSQSGDRWLVQVAQSVAQSRGDDWEPFSYLLPTGVALNQGGWTAPSP